MHGWPSINTPPREPTPTNMDGFLPREQDPLNLQGLDPPMPQLEKQGTAQGDMRPGTPQHKSPVVTGEEGGQLAGDQSKHVHIFMQNSVFFRPTTISRFSYLTI